MTIGISKLRPHETKDEPLREEKTVRLAQRNSFQTGSCKPKRWKNGDKGYAIRYRVRDPNSETGWRYKRENLRGMSHKQAKKILAERLNEVNATNNNPGQHAPSMTFADFTSGLWKNYLGNKRIKPSTAYSYDSMIDLTYIRLLRELIYLAVIVDAYSRRCIGWALGRSLEAGLAVEVLKRAFSHRALGPGLVHHSDRGVQYASREYTDLLKERGVGISMSRRGNPNDNAKAESFIKTLKAEEVYMYE